MRLHTLRYGVWAAAIAASSTRPPALRAQTDGIRTSAGTHISTDAPNAPFFETFLALNPRDPNNLVATSMVGTDEGTRTPIYASRDGGRTWQRARTTNPADSMMLYGGDPIVYFDAAGTAFFGNFNDAPGFVLSRSSDGGFTWETPQTVWRGAYDRPFMAIDSTGGRFNGRVYAAGAVETTDVTGSRHLALGITFSTDHGRTFAPVKIVTGDWTSGGEYVGVTDLLVTPDGKLVVPFNAYFFPPHDSLHTSHFSTMVSDDGGVTFAPAQVGPSEHEGNGFRMLKSLVAPRAAIDLSPGPYRGRIYLSWTEFDGTKYTVRVARSPDLGRTWSPPVVVNDNANGNDPANPAIAVNKDGVIGVIFNDRRDDPKNTCFRLYFAASVDGGETFLPNVRASDHPTCPQAPGNWVANASSHVDKGRSVIAVEDISGRWPNGGDTQGLVAGPDGTFHSAWINGASGVMQLWSKELIVDTAAVLQASGINHRKDLSGDVTLEVGRSSVDLPTHTVSVTVRLVNALPVAATGPFTVVLEDADGSLRDLRVVNADNGKSAQGAAWNFTVGGKTSLQPHEKSDERVLRWQFMGEPREEARIPLFAHVRVLGSAQH